MNTESQTSGNVLPEGMTLNQLEEAVTHSGYPLQTTTSELLKEHFRVLPEWGYRDRSTGELRTLDILAIDSLVPGKSEQPKAWPFLAVLIECKQSTLPYVFFSESIGINRRTSRIPMICGLPRQIVISRLDELTAYPIPISEALGVHESSFFHDPPRCSVFSKCVRKGKGFELSGTEVYSSIVMPMMSAMEHFTKVSVSRNSAGPRTAFMPIAVAVVDAPMAAYDINKQEDKISFVPWHRVIRNEPSEQEDRGYFGHMGSQTAVDVVHKDFLRTYLTKYVRPLAQSYSELLLRHGEDLSKGSVVERENPRRKPPQFGRKYARDSDHYEQGGLAVDVVDDLARTG